MSSTAAEPKVSVAIITYNQCSYLRACIESVLQQDYEPTEIVVADDGSSDGTQEFLRDLRARLPDRIRLSLAPTNRGITRNSNAALAACTGRYIAWLGGDDLMLPGKLSKQVAYLEAHPECAICYHNLEVFDAASGRSLRKFNEVPGGVRAREGGVAVLVEFGTFLGACSVMVRRSACPPHGFDERIPVESDWLFWIETALHGRVGYIDEVLGRYRRHAANVTLRYRDCTEALMTLGIIEAKYPALAAACRRNRAARLLSAARECAVNGASRRSLQYLSACFRNGGLSREALKLWMKCALQEYAPSLHDRLARARHTY